MKERPRTLAGLTTLDELLADEVSVTLIDLRQAVAPLAETC
jgi:hypothetical protein